MNVKEQANCEPKGRTLVVGLGEVGAALAAILDRNETVLRHDLERVKIAGPVGTMHLCIPFQSPGQFETVALGYIDRFQPARTIVRLINLHRAKNNATNVAHRIFLGGTQTNLHDALKRGPSR